MFWFYATFSPDPPLGPQGPEKSPGKALGSQVRIIKSRNSALVHKSKVVGELKTGYFGFMQLLDRTHPWAPRGPESLGKILRFKVC